MLHHSRTKSFSFHQQPSITVRENRSRIMKEWIDGSRNGRKKRNLSFNLPAKSYSISMDGSNSGESSIDNNSVQTFHQFDNQDTVQWKSEVIFHCHTHRITSLFKYLQIVR